MITMKASNVIPFGNTAPIRQTVGQTFGANAILSVDVCCAIAEEFINSVSMADILISISNSTGKQAGIIDLPSRNSVCVPPLENADDLFALMRGLHTPGGAVGFLPLHAENIGILYIQVGRSSDTYAFLSEVDLENDKLSIPKFTYQLMLLKMRANEGLSAEKNTAAELNETVRQLLNEGQADLTHVLLCFERLGYPSDMNRYVVLSDYVIPDQAENRFEKNEQLSTLSQLSTRLRQKNGTICATDRNGRLLFIIPCARMSRSEFNAQLPVAAGILRRATAEFFADADLTLGIGGIVPSMSEVRKSYENAAVALDNALSLHKKGSTVSFHELGIYQLLHGPGSANKLRMFFYEHMKPLYELNQDDMKDLIGTLSAYVESGFNVRECARKIYVHHNTVRYRLEKISSLCCLNPKNSGDLLTLLVCLEIRKMYPDCTDVFHVK